MAILHDRFWWPPDEGNYAHVAERLLSGEILHRDVQDVHAGYINFINAAAFSLFGVRLVSLRYPLAVLSVVQAAVTFLLLSPRGLLAASAGAVAAASLGFVQFLNPTANWYCLFLALVTIGWLTWAPPGRWRHVGTGLLIGTTFLFRQLSGVLLGMGVLLYLLLEKRAPLAGDSPVVARVILAVLAIGLMAYLTRSTDALGWLLLGIWPFPILLYAWRQTAVPNREVIVTLVALTLGAAVAAVPLSVYHLAHGSGGDWFGDVVSAAASLPALEFVKTRGYLIMLSLAMRGLVSGDLAASLNGAFWLTLLSMPAILGAALLHTLLRGSTTYRVHPLPVIALFYTIVSIHYQVPIYLFYTAGLSLAAVLWLSAGRGKVSHIILVCSTAIIAVIGTYYHAAMGASRGFPGIIAGQRRPPGAPLPLARAGLYVEVEDAARYQQYVDFITTETQPGDSIFAFPSNAELYFLSQRSNPFRFYNTALGIRSSADLVSTIRVLRCHPPKLVLYNPQDKYNTSASAHVARFVQEAYDPMTPLPPFEVFRRKDRLLERRAGQEECDAPAN